MSAIQLHEAKRTEADLTSRMETHLSGSDDQRRVTLAWAGYLVALAEWGQIGHEIPAILNPRMPMEDRLEIVRICEGFDDDDDEE